MTIFSLGKSDKARYSIAQSTSDANGCAYLTIRRLAGDHDVGELLGAEGPLESEDYDLIIEVHSPAAAGVLLAVAQAIAFAHGIADPLYHALTEIRTAGNDSEQTHWMQKVAAHALEPNKWPHPGKSPLSATKLAPIQKQGLRIGDAVVDSPKGPGVITSFTDAGYPRVNDVAVSWLERDDGAFYDPLSIKGGTRPNSIYRGTPPTPRNETEKQDHSTGAE